MIWLIGNKGMLGSDIEIELKKNKLHYAATDIKCDITEIGVIKKFINWKNINVIINSAAYTDVDGAESNIEKAFLINAEAVRNLTKSAVVKNIKIIHFSTDYVFGGSSAPNGMSAANGKKNISYLETDKPAPVSVYGKSKLLGEKFLQKYSDSFYIIRTSWLYGKNGNNFVKTIIKKIKNPLSDEIKMVDDQYGSPTYTKDLAKVVIEFVKKKSEFGIYHFTNEGVVSWYEFAKEIYRIGREIGLIKKEVNLIPVPTSHYPTAAVRPKYSVLSKEKIKNYLGADILRNYTDSLREFLLGVVNE